MKTQYILIEIQQSQDIQEITDIVAGRVYIMDGVEDCTAILVDKNKAVGLMEYLKAE
jgi:hypothetical protein